MAAHAKIEWLRAARAASDAVFARLSPDAMRLRPVRERHRLVFYLGHLEAFDANLLRHEVEVEAHAPQWDRLFARGIDPIGADGLPTDDDRDWPSTDEVRAYGRGVRASIDRALARCEGGLLDAMIEHRLMHVETLAYLAHQLPLGMVAAARPPAIAETPPPVARRIAIPAGCVTLGSDRGFAWDNERPAISVDVPSFAIDAYPATNRDWLAFVEAGGYAERSLWRDDDWAWRTREDLSAPRSWRRRGRARDWTQRLLTAEVPLPLDAPVYVSYAEALAYARWKRARLPTEAEWQRAAYGSPSGEERAFPWGSASDPPTSARGNFDLVRDDPISVTAHPSGASAWGVHDLVGNGWEWTSTTFAPLDAARFEPQSFYPGYSADFFDGAHFVLKGGSARTAARLLRRSFRNWFQPHYPHVYATLRLAES